MLSRKFLSLVLLAASAAAWAQSEPAPAPNERTTVPVGTTAPAQASAGANSTNPQSAPGALPDSTSLEIVKSKRADYPQFARERGIQGQVMLKILVSETGDVEKVDVLSGDPMLAESAVSAVRKWKFKPFIRNGRPIKVSTQLPMDFAFSNKIMEKGRSEDGTAVTGKGYSVASSPAGDKAVNFPADSNGAADVPRRVRVSQGVSQGLLIHQVAPVYPPAARANRVQGAVVLQAVIGKDGRLSNLHVVSGPPELRDAAVGAVQQWRYKPYYLKGEPVEVETQLTINFTLR